MYDAFANDMMRAIKIVLDAGDVIPLVPLQLEKSYSPNFSPTFLNGHIFRDFFNETFYMYVHQYDKFYLGQLPRTFEPTEDVPVLGDFFDLM